MPLAPTSTKPVRLGRFEVEIPQGLHLEALSATREFVSIHEVALDPRWQKAEENKTWTSRIAELKEQTPSDSPPREVAPIIVEKGGTLRLISYGEEDDPSWITWEGLLSYPGVGLWLASSGYLEHSASIRALIETQANRWTPYGTPGPEGDLPPAGTFVTTMGYFSSPATQAEDLYVRWANSPQTMVLELTTRAVAEPEPPPFRSAEETIQLGDLFQISAHTLRDGQKMAAGIVGVEQVITGATAGQKRLHARWWFAGKPKDTLQPTILISLQADTDDPDQFLRLWDELLASLRQAPR